MNKCTNKFFHYEEILKIGLEYGYEFKSCAEYLTSQKKVTNKKLTCILRHDVDFDFERCIHFARIEAKLNIHSTYFFRIHANEYNCLSYESISLIKELDFMGHEIGLHAEPIDIYKATGFDSHLSLKLGKQLLENIINKKIIGVASHNDPTPDNNLDFFKKYLPEEYGFEYGPC